MLFVHFVSPLVLPYTHQPPFYCCFGFFILFLSLVIPRKRGYSINDTKNTKYSCVVMILFLRLLLNVIWSWTTHMLTGIWTKDKTARKRKKTHGRKKPNRYLYIIYKNIQKLANISQCCHFRIIFCSCSLSPLFFSRYFSVFTFMFLESFFPL